MLLYDALATGRSRQFVVLTDERRSNRTDGLGKSCLTHPLEIVNNVKGCWLRYWEGFKIWPAGVGNSKRNK